jgi:hypothetical protein
MDIPLVAMENGPFSLMIYILNMALFHIYVGLPEGMAVWLKTLVMWVKQCHEPPMTGNGKHTTYNKHGDDWRKV